MFGDEGHPIVHAAVVGNYKMLKINSSLTYLPARLLIDGSPLSGSPLQACVQVVQLVPKTRGGVSIPPIKVKTERSPDLLQALDLHLDIVDGVRR